MAAITAGNYFYDIEFTSPLAKVHTLLGGVLTVVDDITY
jgi:hypothetical protein